MTQSDNRWCCNTRDIRVVLARVWLINQYQAAVANSDQSNAIAWASRMGESDRGLGGGIDG